MHEKKKCFLLKKISIDSVFRVLSSDGFDEKMHLHFVTEKAATFGPKMRSLLALSRLVKRQTEEELEGTSPAPPPNYDEGPHPLISGINKGKR